MLIPRLAAAGGSLAVVATIAMVGLLDLTVGPMRRTISEYALGDYRTVFDVAVSGGRTLVQVDEGQVRACTRSGNQCAIVNAGESVTITATGVSRVTPIGGAGPSFAQFCGNDGLCAPTQYASLLPDAGGAGALCGR